MISHNGLSVLPKQRFSGQISRFGCISHFFRAFAPQFVSYHFGIRFSIVRIGKSRSPFLVKTPIACLVFRSHLLLSVLRFTVRRRAKSALSSHSEIDGSFLLCYSFCKFIRKSSFLRHRRTFYERAASMKRLLSLLFLCAVLMLTSCASSPQEDDPMPQLIIGGSPYAPYFYAV